MAVAYPLGLRTIVQANKRRSGPAAFREIAPRRGLGYAQTIGTEPPLVWDITLRFTRAEAATFWSWFENTISFGAEEFTMPIRTEFGVVTYTVRLLPDSLLPVAEVGELWEYTATILARSMVIPGTAPSSSGLATDWPEGLPTFLRASKRRRQDARFRASDHLAGYAHFEPSGTDLAVTWDIELRLTPSQAALFMVWFVEVLDRGVLPFTAPVRTEYGMIVHELKFLPGNLLDCSESGESFSFRASVAARRLLSQSIDVDPLWLATSLLLHGETAQDSSRYAHAVTLQGSAAVSTAQSQFGGSSILIPAGNNGIVVPSSSAFNFGTGDFTIELWARLTNYGSVLNRVLVDCRSSSFSEPTILIDVLGTSNGKLSVFIGGSYVADDPTNFPLGGAFQHVAVCRAGTSILLFRNGVLVDAGTYTGPLNSSGNFRVGVRFDGNVSQSWNGYVDEVRVTKGVARYTEAFTPPTEPFPNG